MMNQWRGQLAWTARPPAHQQPSVGAARPARACWPRGGGEPVREKAVRAGGLELVQLDVLGPAQLGDDWGAAGLAGPVHGGQPRCGAAPWNQKLFNFTGQRHKIFASGFFHESVPPQPQSIPLRPFRIFSKIRGDIHKSRCTTGLNDTGGGGKIFRRCRLRSRWHRW